MRIELDEILIDSEFEATIPSLSKDEFKQLEENILSEGIVRDPLVVWNNTLVDGHNRLRILKQHPEIVFTITSKEFQNRFDAIAWLCRNQLGRRNLTPENRKYLIGKEYDAEQRGHGGDRRSEISSGQVDHLKSGQKTRDIVAKNHNISPRSVARAHDFASALDAAEKEIPGIREKILSGEIRPLQRDVQALARAGPTEVKELAEKLATSSKSAPIKKQNSITIPKSAGTVSSEVTSSCDVPEKLDDPAANSRLNVDDCIGLQETIVPSQENPEQGCIDLQSLPIQEEFSYEDQHEDAVNELEDAVEMFIYRWDRILSIYANILHTETMKADITGFLDQMNTYISKVMEEINERKGTLHYTSL